MSGGDSRLSAELEDVRDFLAAHHPLDLLPAEEVDRLATMVVIRYLARGRALMAPGDAVDALTIVRSGALETRSPAGDLLARAGEGEAAGVRALLAGGRAVNRIEAIEDTLVYQIPASEFARLRAERPAVAYHYSPSGAERLRGARLAVGDGDASGLTSRRVAELLRRTPVTAGPDATVRDASSVMAREAISCLPIVEAGALVGILTDRDLRNRVLAAGRPPDTPVRAVMTPAPWTVPASAFLFEALIALSHRGVHHLPVVGSEGELVGVVTTTDLLRTQSRSVVFLAGDIQSRADAAGIAEALAPLSAMVLDMVEAGVGAYGVGHAVTALADAATRRLIELAEDALGPPPVPYAWLALGSQGRHEQTARSDQDNALLLDDAYDPAAHGAYFEALARRVCDGLATAGFVHCPGEVMALTERWRQPLAVWKRTFARWIDTPDPKALMEASVFFDLRVVQGERGLGDALQRFALDKAAGNGVFLAHLAGNALTHPPPLGLFRNLVLISSGEHRRTLDLKHSGVVPVVDLARLYALDAGIDAVNTRDRLEAARETGRLSAPGARDLIDALDFLALMRLKHQARRIRAGKVADNYLAPEDLSGFERGHLKDAFAVIKSFQAAAATTWRGGLG